MELQVARYLTILKLFLYISWKYIVQKIYENYIT